MVTTEPSICVHCPRLALTGLDTCFDCDRKSTSKTIDQLRHGGTANMASLEAGIRQANEEANRITGIRDVSEGRRGDRSMAEKYPKYYKKIPAGVKELDVYGVCQMFPVDDPSGAINHARKKLLVPGVRTGGKTMRQDIQEAVDTLNRWLQLNPELVKFKLENTLDPAPAGSMKT